MLYLNRPFYRYDGHIELIRFKEYYGMPKGHERDSTYSLSIYAPFNFRANFSQSFPRKILKWEKRSLCRVGCNNDRLFPKKYSEVLFLPEKRA